MLTKFCAENADTRTKKAKEITTAADKFAQHIFDYPIVSPPIVPATLGVYSGLTDPLDFLQRFEGVPLRENSRRDRSKFCLFHDDYGHDTNRCRDLAEFIAEAYEQGKLDHLIAQHTTNAVIMPTEAKPRMCQVINVVEVQGEASILQISEQIVSWKCPSIAFPPASLTADDDKPVVVSCRVANTGIMIMKVHVDTGSSVDVMYEQCFSKLPANIQALMKPTAVSLAGFSGESSWPVGQLELQMELVDDTLRMFGAIPSTIHGMLKFSANKGIGTLISTEVEPFCAMIMADVNLGIEGRSVNPE
ncbi:uncharacterized protein [Rutidosis leptorrhynchoides]|uniref:uncharacterized protein n=1 Tax=Rutidosis leptorrhynchoides TaxID=125765 RepID=UPI003A99F476